jgi:hypothetical protein
VVDREKGVDAGVAERVWDEDEGGTVVKAMNRSDGPILEPALTFRLS